MLMFATYFRALVLLRDARCCVDACACASAPEEALELGGAGAPNAGAFKLSDGLGFSAEGAERSGDADGRRFCDVIPADFKLGRATATPFDISSSSLQNPAGKSG